MVVKSALIVNVTNILFVAFLYLSPYLQLHPFLGKKLFFCFIFIY